MASVKILQPLYIPLANLLAYSVLKKVVFNFCSRIVSFIDNLLIPVVFFHGYGIISDLLSTYDRELFYSNNSVKWASDRLARLPRSFVF